MSNTISISIDAKRARAALKRAPEVMERHIDSKLWRGAEEVAREAKRHAAKAFSNLVNSIRAQRVGRLHYRVSAGMNYGLPVEEGSGPAAGKKSYFPNPDHLRPWVERVLGARGKEAEDKAWMIARSIAVHGTRAQPYMKPSAESMRGRLIDLVRQGVKDGIREVNGV